MFKTAPAAKTAGPVSKGLDGIVAGQSSICFIDGQKGELVYRGIGIDELATNATFEEVVYLLWYGTLPKKEQLAKLRKDARVKSKSAGSGDRVFESTAKGGRADGCPSHRGFFTRVYDEESKDNSLEANWRKSIRLLAKMPTLVANFHTFRTTGEYVKPDPSLGHSANFLYMLNGVPPGGTSTRTMDCALILTGRS